MKFEFLITYRDIPVTIEADSYEEAKWELYDRIEAGEIEPVYDVIDRID